jgi:murein DD-endopeptidase MepM/ murein hydrolase activator NlpD
MGVVAVASFGLGIVTASPVVAQSSETAAEQAAREIGEARDRANAAAQAWAEAQSELDQLDVLTARTEEEIAVLEDEIAELQVAVEEAAINRFVTGSTGGIPLLSGLDGPTDQAQADVFAAIATDISADAFDDYDALAEELADTKARLERQEADTLAAAEYLEQVEAAAYAEVENLREIEAERLQDEAVRKALEAQQAEKLRQADELARQQLAQQQAEAARQAAAADDDDETSTDTATAGSSSGSSGVVVLPPASGGTSGGSTGAVSGGSTYVDGIVCPVAGPSAFGDTWGAPRSGGRRHEGVDMLGPTGTPLAAVVSGYAEFKTNTLGGNAVGLKGSNGNYYYYAHLDRWEGGSRNVTRGEIIGYMGDTGNATGTPHLHFEIHPGGGAAVNPYPSVRAVC